MRSRQAALEEMTFDSSSAWQETFHPIKSRKADSSAHGQTRTGYQYSLDLIGWLVGWLIIRQFCFDGEGLDASPSLVDWIELWTRA